MRQRSTRASWVAALVGVGLVAGGCSGSDDEEPTADPSPSATSSAPPEVVTEASLGEVAGRLTKPQRQRVVGAVQRVVDGWIDAAYLGDGEDPWSGFTRGAAAEARADGDLMSNRDLAPDTRVEATKRAVTVDVLSPRNKPAGATAHVVLRFSTTGDTTQDVRIGGRLYLTKGKQGWNVFGYDVTKDAR